MKGIAHVTLVGNLTREPESRQTSADKVVLELESSIYGKTH